MKPEDNGKKNYGSPADVMLLLAQEAEDVISIAGKAARQEADDETEKMLRQYEQKAKQIVLKIREEARTRADDMAARFRDAVILRVEEASTASLDEAIKSIDVKTGEIVKHLQDTVKKDARQALAEGLVAGDEKPRLNRAYIEREKLAPKSELPVPEEISLVSEKSEAAPKAPEDFETWLMQ
jgi:uncharacterized membrane protein